MSLILSDAYKNAYKEVYKYLKKLISFFFSIFENSKFHFVSWNMV